MLVSAIFSLYRNLLRQKSFLKKQVQPILDDHVSMNDGSLGDEDVRKINHYYGLAVPAVLGEAFCALQGRKMTRQERACSTAQGAMTGLFDDFFDKQFMNATSIMALLEGPADVTGKTSNEKLFRLFFSIALKQSPNSEEVLHTLRDVYDAQVLSSKQANGSLNEEDIKTITYQKGGTSLLFYRTAFSPPATDPEKALLFGLGAIMQLSNDIFDVYKDREAGINTLATNTKHIAPLRTLFRNRLRELYVAAYKIGYAKENVTNFLTIISLGIFSRVLVCLDQLEANEQTSGGQFNVHTYSRKQLICDMDTWKNKIKSIKYSRLLIGPKGKC